MRETKHLNFVNQHIYVGIDVHLKQWTVSIMAGDLFMGTFSQPAESALLIKHLKKNYPGAKYHCVYEAGFSGFGLYEELKRNSIDCIVINPADVPTTHKEKDRKTDKFDSYKLCRCLQRGELIGIHVLSAQTYEERALLRMRATLVRDQTRCKNRTKALLKFYSIRIEADVKQNWSKKYLNYLENIQTPYSQVSDCLKMYVENIRYNRKQIIDLWKRIKQLSETDKYKKDVDVLLSIPGVSRLSAMTILTELSEIDRFKSVDKLCGFIGLIPSEHSSGESRNQGSMTRRGNKTLRHTIIQSSWAAIKKDPELLKSYFDLTKRMKKTRAIISISRKLIGRIMHILKTGEEYKLCVNTEN